MIYRESTVEWMKLRIKSMTWNTRNQKTTTEQQKGKTIQKNKDTVRSLWDNYKQTNIHIIRVPEGKEKEQEIGNLFEKIMKKTSLIW